jgi:hypothetical protein
MDKVLLLMSTEEEKKKRKKTLEQLFEMKKQKLVRNKATSNLTTQRFPKKNKTY